MIDCIARIALGIALVAAPAQAETIPVFTPDDEGRPFVDVYASGLYSETCVDGAGCTCAAVLVDRADLAVVLEIETVSANTQGIWDSPASKQSLTDETAEALQARFGGSAYCPQTALMTSTGQMRLLTPKLFFANWKVTGMSEMGACNWSLDQLVTWVGE